MSLCLEYGVCVWETLVFVAHILYFIDTHDGYTCIKLSNMVLLTFLKFGQVRGGHFPQFLISACYQLSLLYYCGSKWKWRMDCTNAENSYCWK